MGIYEKLQKVQSEMKAPKNLYNSFGKYSYRNAEGICEAFKPFGQKYGLALLLTDEVVEVGGRIYVKATATLVDTEPGGTISVTAFAREAETKKGMDDSQVTGATSSYARKYALNGLFLLDDTKDPDTEEYQSRGKAEAPAKAYTSRKEMEAACEVYYKGENLKRMLDYYKVGSIKELNDGQIVVAYTQSVKGRQKS